ncbi:MAG: ArsI/CadI family heavy metal resistance metalloenzyme [Myxococcota bacterium]
MKRFHVHVAVENLDDAVRFYSGMFGVAPTVKKPDYAKWMLEDPRVNFAISARGQKVGVDHLGIQVESRDELQEVYGRMASSGELLEQGNTTCCYAQSEKGWVHDPAGLAWEAFHTVGESTVYGEASPEKAAACCAPTVTVKGGVLNALKGARS